MRVMQTLYAMLKKPTAQTAHLVFADTLANAGKTKRDIYCQRYIRLPVKIIEYPLYFVNFVKI